VHIFDGDPARGAIMHNQPGGAASGRVEVSYLAAAGGVLAYQDVEKVITDPDADTSFVQALFHNVLLRNATAAELSQGLTLLQGPGGRDAVANWVERSDEALTGVVVGWFTQYLNRQPMLGDRALVQDLVNTMRGGGPRKPRYRASSTMRCFSRALPCR
jgi:hypothetical protein